MKYNSIYSRDNLQKVRYGAYIINLSEYSDIRTHWVTLYVQNDDVTYFDSFRVEHTPKEIRTFISNKNIKTNIFRIQANDWIMCGYFCIGFVEFMPAWKILTEFTSLFHQINLKQNVDIIPKFSTTNILKRLNAIPLIMVFIKHLICIQIWVQLRWTQFR